LGSNYDHCNDAELAEAAKGGDREARNTLFMRHRDRIKKLCYRGSRTAARFSEGARSITGEDVEQQAFLIFCELLETWDASYGVPFSDYLREKMPWKAVHYVRASLHYRARRRVLRLIAPLESGDIGPESAEAAQSLEDVEDRDAWAEQTDALDKEWKRLIKMRYEQGLTGREIAALRGCSARKVSRELRAATDALREQLQDGWEGCA
jgi:RNA polymerase sigma factor (sigma-70 family)